MSILNKIDFKNLSTKHLKEIISKSNYRKEKKALLTAVLKEPVNCRLDKEYAFKKYLLDKDLYELQIVLCLFHGWSRIYNNVRPSLAKNLLLLSRIVKKIERKANQNDFFGPIQTFSSETNFSPLLNVMLALIWRRGSMKLRQQIIDYFNLKPTSFCGLWFNELPMRFIRENQKHYKRKLIEHMKKFGHSQFYKAPDFIKCDQEVVNEWLSMMPAKIYDRRHFPSKINELRGFIEALLYGCKHGNKKSRKSFIKEILTHKKVIEKIRQLFSLRSNKNWLGTFFKVMRNDEVSPLPRIPYPYSDFEKDISVIFHEYLKQDIIIYEILDCVFLHKIQHPQRHVITAVYYYEYEDPFFEPDGNAIIETTIYKLKDFDKLNINALKLIFLYHTSNHESSNPFVAVHIQKLIDDKEKRKSIEMNKYDRSASNILFARNNHMKFNKKYVSEDKKLDFIIKKNTSIATSMSSLKRFRKPSTT